VGVGAISSSIENVHRALMGTGAEEKDEQDDGLVLPGCSILLDYQRFLMGAYICGL
jgi:hypothetical protein